MKMYYKIVAKIQDAVGIGILALGFRYGRINLSLLSPMPSNSTQQMERVDTFVEENIAMEVDGKVIRTGSGILIGNQRISEGSKSALTIRSGELGKSGPGPRAKADARRSAKAGKYSSVSSIIPGAYALVPQNTYCRYHQNAPLSCKPRVKLADDPFQGDGGNNQPPPENGNFDSSQYKGGPNPFLDKFDYDNPNQNHTRENTDFSSQKRMNHAYDRHAEKCFGMKENRNKENLKEFEGKARSFIESPKTEKLMGHIGMKLRLISIKKKMVI